MISNNLFTGLHLWAGESTGNWNQLVGGSFVLFVVSCIVIFRGYYLFNGWNLFSKGDERTSKINMYATAYMFIAFVILDLVLPHDFMWQIFFLLKYSLVFLVGGIYLLFRHYRDLN